MAVLSSGWRGQAAARSSPQGLARECSAACRALEQVVRPCTRLDAPLRPVFEDGEDGTPVLQRDVHGAW